mmetsp:Transcript_24253/g.42270  ORF Transcript_24253/g.42270 Transcript_24253/m.42270 type:complete len:97 (+) Transcript_24253:1132-1422(+)
MLKIMKASPTNPSKVYKSLQSFAFFQKLTSEQHMKFLVYFNHILMWTAFQMQLRQPVLSNAKQSPTQPALPNWEAAITIVVHCSVLSGLCLQDQSL